MKSVFKVILIGADALVLSLLVVYMIHTKNITGDLMLANDKQMAEERAEFASGGLDSLCVDTLTGTQVISAIRKYKDNYTICIASANTGAVLESYDSNTAFSKSATSIKPEYIYSGRLNTNSAGNVVGITFTKQIDATEISEITTADEARAYMISAIGNGFGLTPNSSWSQIYDTIVNNTSMSVKVILSEAVEGRVSVNESTVTLAQAASDRITELQRVNSSKKSSITLNVGPYDSEPSIAADIFSSSIIGFNPSVVIATLGSSGETFVKYNGVWISSDSGLTTTQFDVKQLDGVYYILNLSNDNLNVIAYE